MSRGGSRLRRAVLAELVKLRGLPTAIVAVLATVAGATGLTAAIAASAPAGTGILEILVQLVVFLQIGPIVLGVLAVASEYAGSQIRTSLAAVPSRPRLLLAKIVALALTVVVTSLAAVGSAVLVVALRGGDIPAPAIRPLIGAVGYLVAMGLLAFALALLLRSLVAPLAGLLSLVLVVSPLVASATEYARWLPDRAGSALYAADASDLAFGSSVILGWVLVVLAAAGAGFVRRDA